MLSLTIPIYKIEVLDIKQKHIPYIILVILLFASIIYVVHDSNKGERAYLHHGVWANSTYQYHVDSLQSKGSYSYSELVKLLMADTISSLDIEVLEKYTELWIITPTKPFIKEELEHLKEWVFKGGKLIVSSDHTDLFGHARCCNQIASLFNCKIGISATYDADNRQYFRDSKGDYYLFKTGTSFSGFAFPMWSTWLWEEDAYYMENNFFGPLSPSGDDLFSIKIMLAQVPYGLGEVSFIQDSTIFANFCLFQPGTLDLIKQLSSHSFIAKLYLILIVFFFLLICAELFGCVKAIAFITIFCPLLFLKQDKEIYLGEHVQLWSGNKDFVIENNCPYATIATAYSLSPLSGLVPIWTSPHDTTQSSVIWVDSIPPPNENWRWIKVSDYHPTPIAPFSRFDSLYMYLGIQFIDTNYTNETFTLLNMNGKFNDAVMNDWWYDSGILKNRDYRIKKWLMWLKEDSAFYDSKIYFSDFTDTVYDAILRIDKQEPILLKLPKPLAIDGEVYFGNGVAGKIINRNNKISILGLQQFQENYYSPNIWAIDYQ
jgi:hypothetical protein